MADSPKAFNSRGQILSKGGERYAARLLRGKQSAFDLFKAIDKKFGPAAESTIADIISLAKAGLTSGRLLDASERIGSIDPTQIPENPYLFGGDSGKGRAYIGATVGMPENPYLRDMAIILPAELAWPDISEAVTSSITKFGMVYTSDTTWKDLLFSQEMVTTIWFAERMF